MRNNSTPLGSIRRELTLRNPFGRRWETRCYFISGMPLVIGNYPFRFMAALRGYYYLLIENPTSVVNVEEV